MKRFDFFHIAIKRLGTYAAKRAAESPVSMNAESIQKKLDARTMLAVHKWLDEEGYCIPDMDITQVAESMGISRLQLARYCQMVHGLPFLSWRKNLRLDHAVRLLEENPELSMAEISNLVGICDRGNFRKQFIEYKGCSPKEWRAEKGGKTPG